MKPGPTDDLRARSRPAGDLRAVGAIFCLFLSLVGAGIGVYLTVLKFRMSYTPCMTTAGSCQVGEMTCDDALASSWSMLLDLPISLWGSALYVLTALLAAGILWRRRFLGGAAPDVLLACAVWSTLMTLVLGGYTFFALDKACPFCMSLYVVSILLLAGALLTRAGPELRRPRAWLAELQQSLPQLGEALFYAALVFVTAAGVQSMTYHGMRNFADSQAGCPEPTKDLPTQTIRAGADDPRAIVLMFIDMTCPVCLKEFAMIGKALGDGEFPEPVQLRVYHTPRQACVPSAFPAGLEGASDAALHDNACLAARAAECVEKLQPGSGFDYIAHLFALHMERERGKPLFTLERVANKAVDLELEIDPDDEDNALFECINNDAAILARITDHQIYAEGFAVPTTAIYRVKDGELDVSADPLYVTGNPPLALLSDYISTQAKAPASE